jgi:hypothetical protein
MVIVSFASRLVSPCPGPNKFKITTPTRISMIPVMLAVLIFSFQIKTEIIEVATIPTPDHIAYAVFKGIVFNDNDKKKKQPMKATTTPIVGKGFENPSDAFNKDDPISSPTIASAKYRYDTVSVLPGNFNFLAQQSTAVCGAG